MVRTQISAIPANARQFRMSDYKSDERPRDGYRTMLSTPEVQVSTCAGFAGSARAFVTMSCSR